MNDWEKAGKITAEAREYGRTLIKKGASILDICDKVDKKIQELGGEPAFPTQIGLNHIAAHFCPDEENDIVLSDELVKLDCGACVNGAIGDTACTVDLSGKHEALVKATEDALAQAIALVKPGTAINELGKVIEDTIKAAGFQPIVNLSGHGLEEGEVHAPPTIPNRDNGDTTQLEEGMIFAIEPFATTGMGKVVEGGKANLYTQLMVKPVRSPMERKVMKAMEAFDMMPFVSRWIDLPSSQKNFALRNLKRLGVVMDHPPLIEVSESVVAQAEHSVIVTEKGCVVLTK